MKIKSFRGLITNGGTDTVALHTNNGSTGYRIKNLRILSAAPGVDTAELIFKIHTINTAVSTTVDFSDQTLLAIAYFQNVPVHNSSAGQSPTQVIVFDDMTFNQDIYLQASDVSGNAVSTNYYFELEQMPLALDENTVATLKDIRNIVGNV